MKIDVGVSALSWRTLALNPRTEALSWEKWYLSFYKDLDIVIESQPMKVGIDGNVASGSQEIEYAWDIV